MNSYFKLPALLILLISSFFIFSCKKNDNNNNGLIPDLTSKVTASVSGFVTDENDAAVQGATASFGSLTATSDKYGYFEIKNTSVAENGAIVTITKPGYFKGIKTFITSEGKSSFCRIKLIPKIIAGTINTSSGGSVSLSNGLKVSLPANAVVNAATNVAYTGTINVSSRYIDPTSSDLARIMPGDLTGINSSGVLKSLASYGMAVVELTGSSGELLQIASGQKATLTMPISSAELAKAPTTIPLWYFDETKGYWKEEGSATKTGNAYVGDVAHFSYWNCDYPFADAVKFTCTLLTNAGVPLPNTDVRIFYGSSITDTTGFTGCHGYSDASGYVEGIIPANSQLIIAVFTYTGCLGPTVAQTFTTTNADIALGNVTVQGVTAAIITGNVINCNSAPVTNGYINIALNGLNSRYKLSNTGTFSASTILCGSNTIANLTAEDEDALEASNTTPLTLVNGNNSAGTLQACNNSLSQFFNYTIDGTSYSFTYPADFFYYFNGYATAGSSSPLYRSVTLNFNPQNIAVGSTQNFISFVSTDLKDSVMNPSLKVNITECGAIGEYISGNLSGPATGMPPNYKTYNITCNFRIKRSQ